MEYYNNKLLTLMLGERMTPIKLIFAALSLFPCSNIYANNITTQKFEAILGATRVIYHLDGNGESLRVKNPQDYPILIQSKVMDEGSKDNADFIVTPPLFRLDAKRETDIRIVMVNGLYPKDRESLKTLCVRGIPPKQGDLWANNEKEFVGMKLNVSINTCIKLILRPHNLPKLDINSEGQIEWGIRDGNLVAKNKTPYYFTIVNASFNGKALKTPGTLGPYEQKLYTLPSKISVSGLVKWEVIGDLGESSETKKFNI